jgi:hypothetical protein
MLIREAIAPSYKQLRPLKEAVTATFPVYHGLVEKLLTPTTGGADATLAHVLGTCAGYAYADERTVAMIMARMGFEDARCRTIGEYVDAMFICSTAFLVQSKCGRVVVLCYRGTEPTNFINWLTAADVYPQTLGFAFSGTKATFLVHGGFYRNVRATRFEVIASLQRALSGQSILADGGKTEHPLQALYITGHSLGAAMAALMGVMLTTERAYAEIARRLRAVYTFGQPMIGSPEFAAACDDDAFLGKSVFRYVYGHDVVPALPPALSGPFAHFGSEHRAKADNRGPFHATTERTKQVPHLLQLAEAPLAFLARQVKLFRNVPFQYSLDDHGPQHYIGALTPDGVRTEFGD